MGLLVINLLSLSSKPTLLNTFSDAGDGTLEATFSFAKWLSYALLVGASGERLEVWEMKEEHCPSDVTAATLLHGSTGPTAAFLGSLNQSGCPFPENTLPAGMVPSPNGAVACPGRCDFHCCRVCLSSL